MTEILTNSTFKVLVIKPSSLGDVIHAFPAVNIILKKYPNAEIDWFIHPTFAPILEYFPRINKKIIFQRKRLSSITTILPELWSIKSQLREKEYDLVLDLQGLMRSAFFSWLTKSKMVVGFAKTKEQLATIFYKKKITIPAEKVHAVDKNIALVSAALDITEPSTGYKLPVLNHYLENMNAELTKVFGKIDGINIIGIIPGARWKSKKWPPHFFAKTINEIRSKLSNVKFIILGSPVEVPDATEILKLVDDDIYSFTGKTTLIDLVELIRSCRLILTNDSGPMHIAASLNIQTFALFGPTDPDKTGPYGETHKVYQDKIECIKCLKRECPDNSYLCHDNLDHKLIARDIIDFIK